jgi:hypothetical protein
MMPRYELDTNNVIKINLPQDNIIGEFLVEKISYNLTNNFTMTISCNEIIKEY